MQATTTQRAFNFSAGPAVLPLPVLEEAQRNLLGLPGLGISVLEISHRGKAFEAIHAETKATLREVLNIPENYHVLFLQGGASTQFSMIPINFMPGKSAGYVRCGQWSKKAVVEAKREGDVTLAWDGQQDGYNRMPASDEIKVDPRWAYLHTTSNETIEGISLQYDPIYDVPVVCDMSSNILSKPIDVTKYALIYAGAQKNMGPAGVTTIIIRDDFLAKAPGGLHTMLDYKVMAEHDSIYNTPPVFPIYIVGLVAKWLRDDIGGLANMERINHDKSQLLYNAIDSSGGYYRGHAVKDSRSPMNVTFRLPNEELDAKFIKEAAAQRMLEMKGHRSTGGIRASIYNAFPIEGVKLLVEFMREFQRTNG